MAKKKDENGAAPTNGADTAVAEESGVDLTKSNPTGMLFLLVGKTPLRMDHFPKDDMVKTLLLGERTPKDQTSSVVDRCVKKIYRNTEGKIIIPGTNLFSCLVNAGKKVKYDAKANISTAKATLLPQFLSPVDHEHVLITPTGKGQRGEGWEPSTDLGRLPGSGIANCLVRPQFDNWAILARFIFDPALAAQITEKTVVKLFEIAGAGFGLGSFNPAHKGIYGMFRVARYQTYKVEGTRAELFAEADQAFEKALEVIKANEPADESQVDKN